MIRNDYEESCTSQKREDVWVQVYEFPLTKGNMAAPEAEQSTC